jgi:hypothetical protein
MRIKHLGRKAALALAVPAIGFGLIAGTTSAFAGQPPPPKPPPVTVKVIPAQPVYGVVSCVAANKLETQELADLTGDLGYVNWQLAHVPNVPANGWTRAILLQEQAALEAQIKGITIVPCPVVGYKCPGHDILTTVDTVTWPNGKHAKPVVVVTHECVVVPNGPPKV